MLQAKLIISGKVQGVFYRAQAKKIAQKFSLSGWAKNEPDGNVFILAQGEKASLEQFIEWCKKGPPLAKVENVELTIEPTSQKLEGFYIK